MTQFRARSGTQLCCSSGAAIGFLLLGLLGCASEGGKADSSEPLSSGEEQEESTPEGSLGRGEDRDDADEGETDSVDGGGGALGIEHPEHCLTFMSWGAVALQGAVPGESGMDAIVSWLNDKSSARGEHFSEKPEITPEFLGPYDVVLLQNLGGWDISDDEIEVFQEWIRAGGGVMSLSGYEGDAAQVTVTNRLLSFTGMNYSSLSDVGDTSMTLGVCGYCLGSTNPQEGWNPEHPISEGILAVGAFAGRSIQGDGEIVAQEEGKILGMTEQVDAGRVFLFHDDWISYEGAWSQGASSQCSQNTECSDVSPQDAYQVARLWSNAFNWLATGRECFHVEGVGAIDPE